MKLLGTVDVVNRLAHSTGHGASSKLGKPCQGVLQIRNRSDGRQILMISTKKDMAAFEYEVDSIQKLRTQFLEDGKATIEIKQPPMNVMLRKCKPEELRRFTDDLLKLQGGKKTNATNVRSKKSETVNTLSIPSTSKVADGKEKVATLRKSVSVKRARSPELSKIESAKIKKHLDSSERVISVRSRDKYPKEFFRNIERITIREIRLRKIDHRMLGLKWLNYLNLSGNCVKDVKELANLSCVLQVLILSQNEICNLPDELFKSNSLRSLVQLDLSKNMLTKIPSSFFNLIKLADFNISGNQIRYLPYNWMEMKNLRTLNISDNKLTFVPATIINLGLTGLDMSNNPDLHAPNQSVADYVGYSTFPTLFETTCEAVMNMQRQKRLQEDELFPSVIQSYLHAGKYCIECRRLTLRFKIIRDSVVPRSFCHGLMASCAVSPAMAQCLIKKIICLQCDSTLPRNRTSRVN